MSDVGHNSNVKDFITRIGRIEDEITVLKEDQKSIYAEAKAAGHNPAAMKQALKLHRLDADKRYKCERMQETVEEYRAALGDFADLPLGKAAVEREFG